MIHMVSDNGQSLIFKSSSWMTELHFEFFFGKLFHEFVR